MSRLSTFIPPISLVWCYVCGKPVDQAMTTLALIDSECQTLPCCYDHFDPTGDQTVKSFEKHDG